MHIRHLFLKIHESVYAQEARARKDANAASLIREMYSAIRSVILDKTVSHQVEDLHNHMMPGIYTKISTICGFTPPVVNDHATITKIIHDHATLTAMVEDMQATMKLLVQQTQQLNDLLKRAGQTSSTELKYPYLKNERFS